MVLKASDRNQETAKLESRQHPFPSPRGRWKTLESTGNFLERARSTKGQKTGVRMMAILKKFK
jgi:hypothetical protein